MSTQKRKTPLAEFQIGDKVRVRHGVMDTDFPDMPPTRRRRWFR